MKAIYFLLFSLSLSAHAEICELSAAQVLENSPGGHLVKWDFPNADILSERSLPDSAAFDNFRTEVSGKLDTSPYKLLDRYAAGNVPPADLYNLKVVANKRAGVIHPVNCLEALLLDYQLQRGGEAKEFLAYYLRRQGALRIYFFTNDKEGIKIPGSLLDRVGLDQDNGWSVSGNLHNHTFRLGELESGLPQGVLSPSAADIGSFRAAAKDVDLTAAYITNGFHTVRIKQDDFAKFHE